MTKKKLLYYISLYTKHDTITPNELFKDLIEQGYVVRKNNKYNIVSELELPDINYKSEYTKTLEDAKKTWSALLKQKLSRTICTTLYIDRATLLQDITKILNDLKIQ